MFFVSTSNITKLFDKNNSYSFEYQKNSYFILGCAAVVQEGNIRKTMAARGLVNGRGPRSGRDLVFRCYPPELLLTPQKKKLTFWVSLNFLFYSATCSDSRQHAHCSAKVGNYFNFKTIFMQNSCQIQICH